VQIKRPNAGENDQSAYFNEFAFMVTGDSTMALIVQHAY